MKDVKNHRKKAKSVHKFIFMSAWKIEQEDIEVNYKK